MRERDGEKEGVCVCVCLCVCVREKEREVNKRGDTITEVGRAIKCRA